jgi:hypothetical protein
MISGYKMLSMKSTELGFSGPTGIRIGIGNYRRAALAYPGSPPERLQSTLPPAREVAVAYEAANVVKREVVVVELPQDDVPPQQPDVSQQQA